MPQGSIDTNINDLILCTIFKPNKHAVLGLSTASMFLKLTFYPLNTISRFRICVCLTFIIILQGLSKKKGQAGKFA